MRKMHVPIACPSVLLLMGNFANKVNGITAPVRSIPIIW